MKYIKINTPDTVVDAVASKLSSHLLSGEHVVWLLSGGSAIGIQALIAQKLQTHDTSRLTVGLIDERYGPVGHKDENYLQLMNANFPLPVTRVLSGCSVQDTTSAFGAFIDQALGEADFSLGIFGIGPDGHTAGIKPGSPAISSPDVATFYEWDDYSRITITPSTIKKIDEVVVYANGAEKTDTLRRLMHTDTSVREQPAQILKTAKTSTLYTDNDVN